MIVIYYINWIYTYCRIENLALENVWAPDYYNRQIFVSVGGVYINAEPRERDRE